VKNKKGKTIYSEPIRFGYPAYATGSVLVWIPKRMFKAKHRKDKTRYGQMPVAMIAWINTDFECVEMVHQSLQ
jgi:hypothetical protein